MQYSVPAKPNIGDQVLNARSDDRLFSGLVREQTARIKYAAYKAVGHFVTESDDEWAVALNAFHEAVQKYDPSKGSFFGFADLVIKRRLQDEFRRSERKPEEVPLEQDHIVSAVYEDTETVDLRHEIEAFTEQLKPYNIAFSDLAATSPKAEKTRKACARAVMCIASDSRLAEKMRRTRTLPSKEITLSAGIPPKILERHRKYIIAAAEIIIGDYPALQQFVRTIREEGKHESSCDGI